MNQQPEFEWAHFLSLATKWASTPNSSQYIEALYRSVISRAYYAGYHTAETLALELGMESTSTASDHYHVREFFENRGRVARQLSLNLRELYRLRIDADYRLHERTAVTLDAKKAAHRAIELSRTILQLVAHLEKRS